MSINKLEIFKNHLIKESEMHLQLPQILGRKASLSNLEIDVLFQLVVNHFRPEDIANRFDLQTEAAEQMEKSILERVEKVY